MNLARLPDGGLLAYRVDGPAAAPPLLLVRPLGGTMALWGPLRDELARDFRVVSFDRRGTGASSPLPPVTTTRTMAADARELLDVLAVERAHVVGLSLGGMVAAHLAADAPGRVRRLVLASTAARGLEVSRCGLRRARAMAGCLVRPSRGVEACLVRGVLSRRFRREHPAEARALLERVAAEGASRATLLRLLLAAATHDARARLGALEVPTLLLVGELDRFLDRAALRETARRLPQGRLVEIAGAGHDLSIEAPAATARVIREFLQAEGARAGAPR